MTTYYLSTVAGKPPSQANVSEATSSPTAEVIVTIGSGNVAAANISRAFVIASLLSAIGYLIGDDKAIGGAGNIPLVP